MTYNHLRNVLDAALDELQEQDETFVKIADQSNKEIKDLYDEKQRFDQLQADWKAVNTEHNIEIERQGKTIEDLRTRLEASEVKYLKLLNEYRERTRN